MITIEASLTYSRMATWLKIKKDNTSRQEVDNRHETKMQTVDSRLKVGEKSRKGFNKGGRGSG